MSQYYSSRLDPEESSSTANRLFVDVEEFTFAIPADGVMTSWQMSAVSTMRSSATSSSSKFWSSCTIFSNHPCFQ